MAIETEAQPVGRALSGGRLSEILSVSRGLGESPNTGDPVLKPGTSAEIEVSSLQRKAARRIAQTAGERGLGDLLEREISARRSRSLGTHRDHREMSTEIDQQHRQTRLS